MKRNCARGAGLLELLLAMVVGLVMITASLRYYALYEKIKKVNTLKTSAAYLMDALNSYYFAECKKGNMIVRQDIKSDLITLGLLSHPIDNPWGGVENLTAEVVEDDNHFYQLKVTANIIVKEDQNNTAATIAAYIRSVLNGDPLQEQENPSSVTWTRLPSYNSDSLNSLEWIFESKPVSLMSLYGGLSSNLWVLNRQLAWFTKQNEQNQKSPCIN